MKSIVAFVGSAKHNGNIDSIVKKILEDASENELETKIYYLNDMNIKYCQGCLYCRKSWTIIKKSIENILVRYFHIKKIRWTMEEKE